MEVATFFMFLFIVLCVVFIIASERESLRNMMYNIGDWMIHTWHHIRRLAKGCPDSGCIIVIISVLITIAAGSALLAWNCCQPHLLNPN